MAEKKVTAPLPGHVKKILVNTEQKISEKEPVLIIEAMKMENKIYSKAPGTVKEIYVSEGQTVRAGADLIAVEVD
jgi:biotin carboxyl carrier protein